MDRLALLVMIAALVVGSLLSALHACLVELTRAALEQLAESRLRHGTRYRASGRILADVQGHARAVALARIVCNLTVAVTSVFLFASMRGTASPDLTDALIGVAGSAVLLWIFTVSIPESIARHAAERFVYHFGPVVRATYLLQRPLSPLARAMDAIIRKIAGVEVQDKQSEVAEELLSVVEEGEREGAIDVDERRMLEAVMQFKSRTVEQIMTPRNEIEALEFTNNLGAIAAFVRKVRHSRIPVYKHGGSLDDVIGFFYVKDLLRWLAGDGPRAGSGVTTAAGAAGGFDLKGILRPALHVPDSKTIRQTADEFVAKKVHAAMVVDEYGAVTGLVTMEDIVEEVFGDIQDEYEKVEDALPEIEVKPDSDGGGQADIDARAYVGDVNEALETLGVTIPEADEYDTVGGFVLSTLGHMPEVNESFSHGRMQVTVLEASPTRVLKIRVQVRPEFEPGDAGGNGRHEPAGDRAK